MIQMAMKNMGMFYDIFNRQTLFSTICTSGQYSNKLFIYLCRVKVVQSCRDFKKLFKETRERSIKALSFVKRLRSDLGVAATFQVNVPYSELLEKLKSSEYIQVILSHQPY